MGGWVSDRYPYSGNLARQLSVKVWENPVINAGIGISPANPAVGQLATATLSIKNFSAATTWVGTMVIAARDPSGRNVDFEEISNVTLAPGATYTYSKTRTFNTPGDHSLFIVNWRGGGFDRLYPKSIDGNIVRQTTVRVLDNPIVSSGVTMTPAAPAIGQPATVSVSIRNASASAVNIGSFFVAARSPSGRNLDFPEDTNISIAPNTVYTYSKTQTFTGTGDHSLFMVNWRGGGYDRAYPKSLDSSIARQATVQVVDNPLVTGGITLSPTSPTSGQTVTASVAIRNASAQAVNIGSFFIAARDPLGNNIDFPEDTNIVIPANSTYTYSKSKPLTTLGKYSFFMVNWRGGGYDRNYPKSADSTVVRQLDFRLNQ